MSYIKTFIEDYFRENEREIYNPIPIKYIIYNSQTHQFHSSSIPSINKQYEYSIEVLSSKDEFTIFISHPIDDEYFFIESIDCEIAEGRIYDYYDFYDIVKNDIDISQEYTTLIDYNSMGMFNVTITKYSTKKKIDTFEVIHFSREYN
jgi:tRNA G10  N-methylase Trm11